MKLSEIITHRLAQIKMLVIRHIALRSLVKDTTKLTKTQAEVLQYILKKNQNTHFGKHYNFPSIKNSSEFIKQIPVHNYEDLRPYIERQIETGEHCIVTEKPIMYAQTSGTTGKPKYIPILKSTIKSYKRAQQISSYIQYSTIPRIFSGKIMAIVSPAIEGFLNNGTAYGSMSGLIYQNMPDIILSKYILPPVIFEVSDYESKYRLIAAFALREQNISFLATANPSTLNRISGIINKHSDSLIEFIATGNLDYLNIKLDKEQRHQLTKHCKPDEARAIILKNMKEKGVFRLHDLWPNLSAIMTWTSGNCGLLIPGLRKELLPKTKIIEMGYLSSEFRGTITIDCKKNLGVPTIQDNFFEFSEVNNWDNGNKDTVLLSQLEKGKKYYIIVTTPNGLYRYFINDIIEVTGQFQNTPTISFVQKGKGVTNLTGEKLYESQVIQAVRHAACTHKFEPEFFMMLADQQDFSYTLYIESKNSFDTSNFTKSLNTKLGDLNIEYLSKAQSSRIKFLGVKRLKPGTFETYKAHCIKKGQREGQFKIVHLQYHSDILFPFWEHIEP